MLNCSPLRNYMQKYNFFLNNQQFIPKIIIIIWLYSPQNETSSYQPGCYACQYSLRILACQCGSIHLAVVSSDTFTGDNCGRTSAGLTPGFCMVYLCGSRHCIFPGTAVWRVFYQKSTANLRSCHLLSGDGPYEVSEAIKWLGYLRSKILNFIFKQDD